MFTKNIILDEGAFENASSRLKTLSGDMQNLKTKIENLMSELRIGFDTPAGEKFFKLCGDSLVQPLDDQAHVIEHIAENLREARAKYSSVFTEYQTLNNAITSAQT